MTTLNVDKTQELIQNSTDALEEDVEKLLHSLQDNFTLMEKVALSALSGALKEQFNIIDSSIKICDNGEFVLAMLIQMYAISGILIHRTVDPVNIFDMEKFCSTILHESVVKSASLCKAKHNYKL